jgi:hypothetical protein
MVKGDCWALAELKRIMKSSKPKFRRKQRFLRLNIIRALINKNINI